MSERWRPVIGHESKYEVSNLGRVRRSAHGKRTCIGKIRKQIVCGTPYPTIWIGNKKHYVHILVLNAFRGRKPFKEAQGRHMDGNPLNCKLDNLQWGTVSQNNLDKVGHGTSKRKLTVQSVLNIRSNYESGMPMKKLADTYEVSINTIFQIIHRITYEEV